MVFGMEKSEIGLRASGDRPLAPHCVRCTLALAGSARGAGVTKSWGKRGRGDIILVELHSLGSLRQIYDYVTPSSVLTLSRFPIHDTFRGQVEIIICDQ